MYSGLTESSIISLYLRSNWDYDIHYRSYKNFVEVVAQIGGIWKILYLIGAALMIPLNKKLLMVSLGNKIFNLIDPNNVETEKEDLYETQNIDSNLKKPTTK